MLIKVRDFSTTPGARYRADGNFSGEEFRDLKLEPALQQGCDEITIDLDGTEGYATSFLEEAFGGLARKYGAQKCKTVLRFISFEEPALIDEILGYITDVG